MTPHDFLTAKMQLYSRFPFSETSGKRTAKHNQDVDGEDHSPHLFWVGQDVIPEHPYDPADFVEAAHRVGLLAIPEEDHIHLQPLGWQPG